MKCLHHHLSPRRLCKCLYISTTPRHLNALHLLSKVKSLLLGLYFLRNCSAVALEIPTSLCWRMKLACYILARNILYTNQWHLIFCVKYLDQHNSSPVQHSICTLKRGSSLTVNTTSFPSIATCVLTRLQIFDAKFLRLSTL